MPTGAKGYFTISSGRDRRPDAVRERPKAATRTTTADRHVLKSGVLQSVFALRKVLSLDGHLSSTTGPLAAFGGLRV